MLIIECTAAAAALCAYDELAGFYVVFLRGGGGDTNLICLITAATYSNHRNSEKHQPAQPNPSKRKAQARSIALAEGDRPNECFYEGKVKGPTFICYQIVHALEYTLGIAIDTDNRAATNYILFTRCAASAVVTDIGSATRGSYLSSTLQYYFLQSARNKHHHHLVNSKKSTESPPAKAAQAPTSNASAEPSSTPTATPAPPVKNSGRATSKKNVGAGTPLDHVTRAMTTPPPAVVVDEIAPPKHVWGIKIH